jgi:hypothetical protein
MLYSRLTLKKCATAFWARPWHTEGLTNNETKILKQKARLEAWEGSEQNEYINHLKSNPTGLHQHSNKPEVPSITPR